MWENPSFVANWFHLVEFGISDSILLLLMLHDINATLSNCKPNYPTPVPMNAYNNYNAFI